MAEDNLITTLKNIPATITEKVKEVVGIKKPEHEEVNLDDKDDLLLKKMRARVREAKMLLKSRIADWEKNMKFFDGKHWEVAGIKLPRYKANIVINKWFAAVRSLVAFETDAKPDPEVEAVVDPKDPEASRIIEGARKVERQLDYRWFLCQIPNKLAEIYYDRYIYDDGFAMYYWDIVEDDWNVEQIKPYELLRSPGSTSVEDAEYLVVQKWRTKKWIKENFPEKVDEVKYTTFSETIMKEPGTEEKGERKNMVIVYHYFEDDKWVTFTWDTILDKKKNPFWEWREETEQGKEVKKINKGKIPPGWKPVKNHLKKPEKPIVHFKGYHLGGEFYSKSLVKQVMPLAFAINKRKCQIQDNADGMGSGQWIIDPSVPESETRKITSMPGLKIRIKPDLIEKVAGIPLPAHVFEDLLHSQRMFDDIVGHHEISRGQATRKRITKGEAFLLRESDITPVRLLMRNSEEAITKLLNGGVQLMKLFYDQPHYIGKIGTTAEGEGEFIKREEIPNNLSIMIKVGSTIPVSKEAKRAEYLALASRGMMDLVSFYELMGYPNPKKLAQRALNWRQGIISDEPILPPSLPPEGRK